MNNFNRRTFLKTGAAGAAAIVAGGGSAKAFSRSIQSGEPVKREFGNAGHDLI